MLDSTTACVGHDAERLLASGAFREGWDALWAACPWSTVFRSRRFVETWYRVDAPQFAPRFAPLIVARGGAAPTGLLLLAREHVTGRVVHAGASQHWYSAWFAPADDATFLPSAGPNAVVLHDFETHADGRARALLGASHTHMLDDAARAGSECAWVTVPAGDAATRAAIEDAGFAYRGSLFRRTVGGRVERSSTLPSVAVDRVPSRATSPSREGGTSR